MFGGVGSESMIFLNPEEHVDSPLLSPSTAICSGCRQPIADRFFLVVAEAYWHSECLRCCLCATQLEQHITCYVRDGLIFCRDDYYRKFCKRCDRCHRPINPKDLVMRARDSIYHVQCFNCIICMSPLQPGDYFALGENGVLYCQNHYEPLLAMGAGLVGSQSLDVQGGVQSSNCPPLIIPAGSGQKGRPKKRKNSSLPSAESSLLMDRDNMMRNCMASPSDVGGGWGMGSSSSLKTKRMRTSFKHHQLRTMKAYFALNHNPDAKDLKQLAQKTGLTKRVLQVWFQNARAKYRRAVQLKGGTVPGEEGEGSTGVGGEDDRGKCSTVSPKDSQVGGSEGATSHNENEDSLSLDLDDGFETTYAEDDQTSIHTSFSSSPPGDATSGSFEPSSQNSNTASETLAEYFHSDGKLL